jgi:hypothetical protein
VELSAPEHHQLDHAGRSLARLAVGGMGGAGPVHPVQWTSASALEPVLDGAQGDLKLESHSAKREALTDGGNQCSACSCHREFSFWQHTRLPASRPELLAASLRLASLASTPRPKALRNSQLVFPPAVK